MEPLVVIVTESGENIAVRKIPEYPFYGSDANGKIWSQMRRGPGSHGIWARHNVRWHPLKTTLDQAGRPRVVLVAPDGKRKSWRVCRLILLAWKGPCPDDMEACHDPNPDPTDNRPENLRWDTRKANGEDMARHGRSVRGSRHRLSKLKEIDIPEIRRLCSLGVSQRKVAAVFGVSHKVINGIMTGRTWSHVMGTSGISAT